MFEIEVINLADGIRVHTDPIGRRVFRLICRVNVKRSTFARILRYAAPFRIDRIDQLRWSQKGPFCVFDTVSKFII